MNKKINVALIALALSMLTGVFTAPVTHALSTQTSGDAELIEQVQTALSGQYRESVSAAFIDINTDTIKYAHFGSSEQTQYEIGSLTKGFTGSLFADAIERGEVSANQKLGSLAPIRRFYPSHHLTLNELATHTSGLPTVASTPAVLLGFANYTYNGADPYKQFDEDDLYAHARISFYLPTKGEFQYSNMGYALLGHALGEAANSSYKQLLQDRLLTPLGMDDTTLPITAANLPANAPTGKDENGTPKDAWTLNAYAPAGGIRSDISDMASYATQLLEGTVPGANSAMTPKTDIGYSYGWGTDTDPINGEFYTNHRGGTGGYASNIILNRDKGKALVILSNTATPYDGGVYDILKHYGA